MDISKEINRLKHETTDCSLVFSIDTPQFSNEEGANISNNIKQCLAEKGINKDVSYSNVYGDKKGFILKED